MLKRRNPARSGSFLDDLNVLVLKDPDNDDRDVCFWVFVLDRPLDAESKSKVYDAIDRCISSNVEWNYTDVAKEVEGCLKSRGFAVFPTTYEDLWLPADNPVRQSSLSDSFVVVYERGEKGPVGWRPGGRRIRTGMVASILRVDRGVDRAAAERVLKALVRLRRETNDEWAYEDVETAVFDALGAAPRASMDMGEWERLGAPCDLEVAWYADEGPDGEFGVEFAGERFNPAVQHPLIEDALLEAVRRGHPDAYELLSTGSLDGSPMKEVDQSNADACPYCFRTMGPDEGSSQMLPDAEIVVIECAKCGDRYFYVDERSRYFPLSVARYRNPARQGSLFGSSRVVIARKRDIRSKFYDANAVLDVGRPLDRKSVEAVVNNIHEVAAAARASESGDWGLIDLETAVLPVYPDASRVAEHSPEWEEALREAAADEAATVIYYTHDEQWEFTILFQGSRWDLPHAPPKGTPSQTVYWPASSRKP